MNPSTFWWIAAGVLVAAELATGTFYLLMLALGAVAAALAAFLGAGESTQMIVGAILGGAAVVLWHRWRLAHHRRGSPDTDPNVHIDIGQSVQVEQWDADGKTSVKYRGAQWSARFDGQGGALPGLHVIRAIQGSVLLLDKP